MISATLIGSDNVPLIHLCLNHSTVRLTLPLRPHYYKPHDVSTPNQTILNRHCVTLQPDYMDVHNSWKWLVSRTVLFLLTEANSDSWSLLSNLVIYDWWVCVRVRVCVWTFWIRIQCVAWQQISQLDCVVNSTANAAITVSVTNIASQSRWQQWWRCTFPGSYLPFH